ncbi:MAG: hypothetical protein AAFV93_22700 [Chloroflexota bacterium]
MGKQQEQVETIYTYIKDRMETQQGSPTLREIADHSDLSVGSVGRILSILEAQGRITRTPYKSRSIRLAEQSEEQLKNEQAELVYDFLVKEMRWGDVPSQQEIAEGCFLSRAEVRASLLWLEAQQRIERVDGQRNIRLIAR